jgi:hypothetical protein
MFDCCHVSVLREERRSDLAVIPSVPWGEAESLTGSALSRGRVTAVEEDLGVDRVRECTLGSEAKRLSDLLAREPRSRGSVDARCEDHMRDGIVRIRDECSSRESLRQVVSASPERVSGGADLRHGRRYGRTGS